MQNEDFLANLISNPAIIGLLSSLITALVTSIINSYTNKRMFRDEIADQQLTIKFWDDYKSIISDIYFIYYKLISTIGKISTTIEQNQKRSIPSQKTDKDCNNIVLNDIIPCLEDLIVVKAKLVLISPEDVIKAFEEYETVAFSIRENPSPGDNWENYRRIYNDLGISLENLIKVLRKTMKDIINRNLKFSELLIYQLDNVVFRPLVYQKKID